MVNLKKKSKKKKKQTKLDSTQHYTHRKTWVVQLIIDFSNLNQKQSKININTHQKKIGGRKNTRKTKRKKVAIDTDKLEAKSKQQTNEQTTSATTIKHRIK